MSSNIHIAGPIAYLEGSQSAVYFSTAGAEAGTYQTNSKGTVPAVRKLQNELNLAFWGEDNRFPQNIEQQMSYCGVGKEGLNRKVKDLWGEGIMPGKIIDTTDGGATEIFQPLPRTNKIVYNFIENRRMFRFWLEYLQDWSWFSNCFPEAILSKDAKTITGLVHQESCDSRFVQMNDKGEVSKVYLSKLWGAAKDQYAKFDPDKALRGLIENSKNVLPILDNKFVKGLDCIDMYDPVNSLTTIAKNLRDTKGLSGFKSAILPTNYPSVNKTLYQVPAWDGARLGGWVEIACKIPSLIRKMYNKAFRLRYHIQVPETYFHRHYGYEAWEAMDENAQIKARKKLLQEFEDFLTGEEGAFNSFISFFDVDPITKKEMGEVKITKVDDSSNIDKDLITGSAADTQILMAMGQHPNQMGAGTIGSGQQRSGGSDIREAKLVGTAGLNLERNVLLEPLYLVRDFNRVVGGMSEWEEDIVFRFRDTVLTTLDTGAGTKKVVS